MAVVIRVNGALGASSRGDGTKERLRDRGLNSLQSDGCFIIYFARLYDAYLMNMLTVQIDFVSRRHNRPVDVGGGHNGFGEPCVYRVFKHCNICPI